MSKERTPGSEEPRTILVFKHEAGGRGGEPIGPVAILTDTRADHAQPEGLGVPFVPICACERSHGVPGERCSRCSGEIPEPWLALSEAKARARELGPDLKET